MAADITLGMSSIRRLMEVNVRRFYALLALPLVACQNPSGAEKQSVYPIMMSAVDFRLVYPQLAWLVGLHAEDVIARLGSPTVNKMGSREQLLEYQSAACDFSIFLVPDAAGEHRVRYFLPLSKESATIELRPCLATVFSQERLDAILRKQP